ncbi:MAG TPA: tail protein X [Acetobacteraceae bacterium]|nr:tail protein X [Acetobacteraceae bacterium]
MSGSLNAAASAASAAEEFAQSLGLLPGGETPPPSVPQFVAIVTGPADRWDTIAFKAYGDPTKVSTLILANPTVPISPVLPQGITIFCPLIPAPGPAAGTTPWSP